MLTPTKDYPLPENHPLQASKRTTPVSTTTLKNRDLCTNNNSKLTT